MRVLTVGLSWARAFLRLAGFGQSQGAPSLGEQRIRLEVGENSGTLPRKSPQKIRNAPKPGVDFEEEPQLAALAVVPDPSGRRLSSSLFFNLEPCKRRHESGHA